VILVQLDLKEPLAQLDKVTQAQQGQLEDLLDRLAFKVRLDYKVPKDQQDRQDPKVFKD